MKYSISELINENIKLKKKLAKFEEQKIIEIINFLELINNHKTMNLAKIIEGLKINLKNES